MEQKYSICLIALLKGIVYDYQKEIWDSLLLLETDVKKYFLPLGLELYLDKSEGYAFLKPRQWENEEDALPRLTDKRQLNFMTSLLCVVLRKYLLEHDASGGSTRSIISEQEILGRIKVFLPSTSDEAKQQERILSNVNRIIDIGFLRRLDGQEKNYEIHRIIKGFVNAEVIDDSLRKLKVYASEKQVME